MTNNECTPGWVDRLYPYKDRKPLHPYIHPAEHITQQEKDLNRGAFKGRLYFHDHILPGGREPTYLQYPQVAVGNWYDRCCHEIPGFAKSLGRVLPDNLTKCSEYREEISEYAKFFNEYPQEDIRNPPIDSCSKCVPYEVLMDHRSPLWPKSYWLSVYGQHYTVPKPAIPPQMYPAVQEKREKRLKEAVDEGIIYCTEYQKGFVPGRYDAIASSVRKIVEPVLR